MFIFVTTPAQKLAGPHLVALTFEDFTAPILYRIHETVCIIFPWGRIPIVI